MLDSSVNIGMNLQVRESCRSLPAFIISLEAGMVLCEAGRRKAVTMSTDRFNIMYSLVYCLILLEVTNEKKEGPVWHRAIDKRMLMAYHDLDRQI